MATDTENLDALRQLVNAVRGAQGLLTVFEDAQAARTLLADAQKRLNGLSQQEASARASLDALAKQVDAQAARNRDVMAEQDRTLADAVAVARTEAASRIDAATEQVLRVERDSQARINEATAKAGVAEAALAETTRQYEEVQAKLEAIKATFR